MSIQQDPQDTLPDPPTGVSLVIAEHEYNPENGHYEPSIRDRPLNANIDSGTIAAPANLLPLLAQAAGWRIWIYHIVLANPTGAAETFVITEPGTAPPALNTYTVEVPAGETVVITSTPDAPLFVGRLPANTAGNFTFGSTAALGAVTATITYVLK